MKQQVRARVREIIGRVAPIIGLWNTSTSSIKSVDATRPQYSFWDLFRRGKQKGFEIGGLFAMPITQIVRDWVMGDGVKVQLADSPDDASNENDPRVYTNNLLKRFMGRVHALLLKVVEDDYALGDQYIIINMDGSLSIPSPDTVKAEYDELDYRKLAKLTVTTILDKVTVTDSYSDSQRVITIKRGSVEETRTYDNLIGRIPAVHFANDRGVNETHGRPIYEALYSLFSKYDDLIRKAIDGAEVMSNPFPVVEGVEDAERVITDNAAEDEAYTNNDGSTKNRVRITLDRMSMLLLGKGASFKFVSPQQGFTDDIRNMLKSLFLLVLDFTRIPEVIWGNEMSSGRSSASESMKTFYAYIQSRRVALEGEGADELLVAEASGGLHALVDIWLRIKSLTDTRIVVAPVQFQWPELSETADEIRQKWAEWAHTAGLILDETALAQAPLTLVRTPAREVELAGKESKKRQDAFDAAVQQELNAQQQQDMQTDAPLDAQNDLKVAA